MARGRRRKAGTLVSLLVFIALAATGWAAGAQDKAVEVRITSKDYTVTTASSTLVCRDGVTVTVSCEPKHDPLCLGLAAAEGSIKVPGLSVLIHVAAGIRLYGVTFPNEQVQGTEATSFKNGMIILVQSEKETLEGLVICAPKNGTDPAHAITITSATKKYESSDGFEYLVESSSKSEIRVRLKSWPAGDPIICWY